MEWEQVSPTPELEQQLLSHDEDRWFRAPNKLTSDSELPHSSSVDRLVVLDVLVTSRLSPSEFSTDCTFETLDTFARCDVFTTEFGVVTGGETTCPVAARSLRYTDLFFCPCGGNRLVRSVRVAQSPAVFSS